MLRKLRGSSYLTVAAACSLASLLAPAAQAQLWTWTKEQMLDYTKGWTGDRFPDGRPKVPDQWLERAKDTSAEEITIATGGRGGGGGGAYSQYEGDFRVLHPELKMAGRAFTVMFMPNRQDLDSVITAKLRDRGIPTLNNQYVIDMLQPGDVLVVDLYGKHEGGTIVGDNLFYYIMKATKGGGLVVDGSFRDLDGIADMQMPCYYRYAHPSALTPQTTTVAGVNIPIRIGNVTVMPGDLVAGDKEGVSFIPPSLAEGILDRADTLHIHDEWTRKKFDEGKYKSSEIYSSPKDPALLKEYQEYLARRLAEIKTARQNQK
jgi:4-hydroxy-4-methyl-2-oxoglutarate aldolase